MGETTGIAWTDHTLNAWMGCTKVSAACRACYAEVSPPVRMHRSRGLELWGESAARVETKEWEKNLRRWDERAFRDGVRRRVFCFSLADVFEDHPALQPIRSRFFAAVERCTNLDAQLLTKRPENVARMAPPAWLTAWPAHVWMGCTAENQEALDARAPHLCALPAPVLFLSIEPRLGALDIMPLVGPGAEHRGDFLARYNVIRSNRVRWVIDGGESGKNARPFDVEGSRDIETQCARAGVAYFRKQLGAYPVIRGDRVAGILDPHGANMAEWHPTLRVQQFPTTEPGCA